MNDLEQSHLEADSPIAHCSIGFVKPSVSQGTGKLRQRFEILLVNCCIVETIRETKLMQAAHEMGKDLPPYYGCACVRGRGRGGALEYGTCGVDVLR